MAPKKKGNKKQQDDWEADLGETITPTNGQAENAETSPAAEGEDEMGGGLLAALRKNRSKKKKGKGADNDFVEGEDPAADEAADFASKAPEEGTFDEDDVFAGNAKPKPSAKKETAQPKEQDAGDGLRVKSKKEKEKEKKEREKQRKKEQVRDQDGYCFLEKYWFSVKCDTNILCCLGCKKERPSTSSNACKGRTRKSCP